MHGICRLVQFSPALINCYPVSYKLIFLSLRTSDGITFNELILPGLAPIRNIVTNLGLEMDILSS